jgi:hypothetical protein
MYELLEEIERAAKSAQWVAKMIEGPGELRDLSPDCYRAETPAGWTLLIVSFSIEDQGFAKGTRGHDGTAVLDGVVVHLGHELAARLYRAAIRQQN